MSKLKAKPEWLKASVKSDKVGVDRENRVIHGYVVAQEGPFKDLRGEFDEESLAGIVEHMNASGRGVKQRFGHPTLSSDGIGKLVARARNARLDTVTVERDGNIVPLAAVRADAHILDVAMKPNENGFSLGEYVMDLAEEDPDAFSSSLVLKTQQEWRTDRRGNRLKDDDGDDLPPLWYPLAIHASDIVDTGDAVDGFLQAEFPGLPDTLAREGYRMLRDFAQGKCRVVVEERLNAWLTRALDMHFGEDIDDEDDDVAEVELSGPSADFLERKLRLKRRKIANV